MKRLALVRRGLVLWSLGLWAGCGGAPTPVAAPSVAAPSTAAPGSAAAPVATIPVGTEPTKLRTAYGISEYALPNGMHVLLFPDASQATVTVNVTYLVGSRHEGYGETGMAHLLEHMAFKGTEKHRNILKLIGERGGDANGSTWTDRTNYYETLPASLENLEWALMMEADRMRNCTISPDDLATEFSVVRNEFEMGENDPKAILEERMTSTAFLWHNYGKSTIGSRSDIEKVPVDNLRAFYDRYYQPDNAILVVAGKFDEAQALAAIEKSFGVIAKPARTLPTTYTVEPVQDGERSVTLRRNGDVSLVGLLYHGVGGAHPDFPVVQAIVDILTREPSGRLYKSLIESKLASDLSGHTYLFRDPTTMTFMAELREAKNVDKVKAAMIEGVEKLATTPISAQEVERWRVATLKDYELAFADSQEIAIQLSEWAALGDWRLMFAWKDRVATVSAADVKRVAGDFLRESNRTSGVFLPTKEVARAPLPEAPDVAAIVKDIVGGEAPAQGEAFVASFDNLDARTTKAKVGGLEAAFLAKKTRGKTVKLNLTLQVGDEKSLAGKQVVAMATASMLDRGTKRHTFQQIEDAKDKHKAKIGIGYQKGKIIASIETLRDDLPAAIDLLVEMLKEPTFPASELEVVRERSLGALEQLLQEPAKLAFVEIQRAGSQWPASDPRYVMSPAEQIAALKKVSIGELKAFHRDFFGATKGEVAVVGDFDPKAIETQLTQAFGGWRAKKPVTRLADKLFAAPAGVRTLDIRDKEMAVAVFGHELAIRDDHADYPPLVVLAQILGGYSGSRIWMRLREAEGLSYGAAAWIEADAIDGVGSVGGFAIFAPQNLEKARNALLDEFTAITKGNITPDELAKAKDSWLKQLDTGLADDDYVIGQLTDNLEHGRSFAFTKAQKAKVEAVTVADVARVAKAYLKPGALLVVEAGDMKKAGR